MIQLVPQMRILVAREHVDFRAGIDKLAALCQQRFDEDPFSGTVFVFRNRGRTAIKLLCYDSRSFWLCHTRLSRGRFQWWPDDGRDATIMPAHHVLVLLANGDPRRAAMAEPWRRLA
jgi:transposase